MDGDPSAESLDYQICTYSGPRGLSTLERSPKNGMSLRKQSRACQQRPYLFFQDEARMGRTE